MDMIKYYTFVLTFITYLIVGFSGASSDCNRFEYHPKHALYGFNDIILKNSSVTGCQTKCIELEDKCKSFDFMNTGICLISSQTKESQPDFFGRHLHSDYFQKVCVAMETTTAPVIMDPDDCVQNQRGNRYTGKISRTASGRTCQYWNQQTPHSHGYKQTYKFVDGQAGYQSNYCRNPKNDAGNPWCYTTDPGVRWEYCYIPECRSSCHTPCYRNPCEDPHTCFAHYPVICRLKFCSNCKAEYYNTEETRVNCDTTVAPPPFTTKCRLTVRGKEYMGKLNKTASGKTCQRWDRQYPHKHHYARFLDASIKDAENYCRNPESHATGLWCYTTDPNTRWERCSVPMCSPVSRCRSPNLWSLMTSQQNVSCYKFFLEEEDHMSWLQASTYCWNEFNALTKLLVIKTKDELDLIMANVQGYLKELTLKGTPLPDKIQLWYQEVNSDVIPTPDKIDPGVDFFTLHLWPGQQRIVGVHRDVRLGFICNEIRR